MIIKSDGQLQCQVSIGRKTGESKAAPSRADCLSKGDVACKLVCSGGADMVPVHQVREDPISTPTLKG